MVIRRYPIYYDLITGVVLPYKITITQGDTNSNEFVVTVTDSGKSVDLSNVYCTFTFKKEDGNVVIGSAKIKNNNIIYTVGTQEISYPGKVTATFEIYGTNNERLSSGQFKFTVLEQLDNGESIESTTEYTALTQALSDVQVAIDNENERIANEEARQSNEQQRVFNEIDRNMNETDRIANESTRTLAESNRVSAENERVQNEQYREEKEEERQSNENIRQINESARQSSEEKREENEQLRKESESIRVSNENVRISNENTRLSRESSRQNNESNRITAENNRVQAEIKRETNEYNRQTNESTRQSNETTRQFNENKRKSNEEERIKNENERIQNEQGRESIISDLVSKFQRFYELPSNIDIEYNEDNNPIKITETYSFGEETLELTYLNGLLYTAKETMITPELVQKEYRHRYRWTQIEDEGELILRLEKVESVGVS